MVKGEDYLQDHQLFTIPHRMPVWYYCWEQVGTVDSSPTCLLTGPTFNSLKSEICIVLLVADAFSNAESGPSTHCFIQAHKVPIVT